MSDKWYTKETSWTDAGIKEQERRADLTKLTAEELIDQIALSIKRANDPYWLAIAEIRLRLERMEKCEAVIDAAQDVVQCMHGDDELPRGDREVLQRLLDALNTLDAARAAAEGK